MQNKKKTSKSQGQNEQRTQTKTKTKRTGRVSIPKGVTEPRKDTRIGSSPVRIVEKS